jgi:hypothetical protein
MPLLAVFNAAAAAGHRRDDKGLPQVTAVKTPGA